jgi:soluble lytic murein transglycosylase
MAAKHLANVLGFCLGLVPVVLPIAGQAQMREHTGSIAISAPSESSQTALLRQAAEAYRRGDSAAGDAISANIQDQFTRRAADWTALRTTPRSLGFARIQTFIAENPDLPMQQWLQRKAEDALIIEKIRPDTVIGFFRDRAPLGPNGKAMLAVSLHAKGQSIQAQELALEAYRDRALTRDTAAFLAKSFPGTITDAEKVLRAHRLVLNNQSGEGLRFAASLGPDHLKLTQALALAARKGEASSILNDVPESMRAHSSYLLAKSQIMRRQDKPAEARDAVLAAPKTPELLADADEWWTERRVLARKLLDSGDASGAFRVVAEHAARTPGRRAEAEFHAGWIALRYLNFPQTGFIHLQNSLAAAETPAAKARALYWLGRAVEAGALGEDTPWFARAARFGTTYYGQLAAAHIGLDRLEIPVQDAAKGDVAAFRSSATGQIIHRLMDAGLESLAAPLAIDLGRTASDPSTLDAAAQFFAARGDATTVLSIGKAGAVRDLPINQLAFPLFGIPDYTPLPGSGDQAMVFAIARQESAFQTRAVSHANARGLMQMLPSTASRTAQRFKVPFNPNRLTEDPAFCAMLGAAHLGELMEETKGSILLTFASYNAGGGRVREWIAAYGDPRKPGVDIIDWAERIPFQETRNYVQRVMENLQVYRARISGNRSPLLITADMESGRKTVPTP